jgi:hypothetical protein
MAKEALSEAIRTQHSKRGQRIFRGDTIRYHESHGRKEITEKEARGQGAHHVQLKRPRAHSESSKRATHPHETSRADTRSSEPPEGAGRNIWRQGNGPPTGPRSRSGDRESSEGTAQRMRGQHSSRGDSTSSAGTAQHLMRLSRKEAGGALAAGPLRDALWPGAAERGQRICYDNTCAKGLRVRHILCETSTSPEGRSSIRIHASYHRAL